MPGLWKAWKAKNRLPTLFHEPLGNLAQSRRDSHIPTAPATALLSKTKRQLRAGYRPPPGRRFAPPQWSPFPPPRWSTLTPPLTTRETADFARGELRSHAGRKA